MNTDPEFLINESWERGNMTDRDKRIASLQSDLDSAVAVLAEKERRIGELEPDAEAYRRLCDIRKKHPGIPCACEFDDDNADQVLSWCNFHAEMRDRIAELEAVRDGMSESNNFAYIVALEAARDFWQESSGQNYVRAQAAEDREQKLERRIEELEAELTDEKLQRELYRQTMVKQDDRHASETALLGKLRELLEGE